MIFADRVLDVPQLPYKTRLTKSKSGYYVQLEVGRTYVKDKKYNVPVRVSIGKVCEHDNTKMYPNHRFYEYFPDAAPSNQSEEELVVADATASKNHSRVVHVGSHLILRQAVEDLNVHAKLTKAIEQAGLQESVTADTILDLASYSIVAQSNKAIHYENYAYNHYLFDKNQRILSGPDISRLLPSVNADLQLGFLDEWNKQFKGCKDVVIGYDSTNKNCQAGDIEIVEFGHAKVDRNTPIYNIAIATCLDRCIPLFYETYGGSIPDVSQLKHFVAKLLAYGYTNVTLVLDRGYFSEDNFEVIEDAGYDFVMMVKGCKSLVHDFIEQHGNEVRCDYASAINNNFGLRGKTVEQEFLGKKRFFHLFFSVEKSAKETRQIQNEIDRQESILKSHENKEFECTDKSILENFNLTYSSDGKTFLYATKNIEAVAKKLSRCGFFCIITSKKMTAQDAYVDYKKRDTSEKLFAADKTFLGANSGRVHTQESLKAVIFILFIALIIRSRIYSLLKDASIKQGKNRLYFNVPKAIKELDKIEIIQPVVGKPYKLSSAINYKARQILSCFGIGTDDIVKRVDEMCADKAMFSHQKAVKGYFTPNDLCPADEQEREEFEEMESSQGIDTLECAILYQDKDKEEEFL